MRSHFLLASLAVSSLITGCEKSVADCWPEIVEKHNNFYFEFDRAKVDILQVQRARIELRDQLATCTTEARMFVDPADLRIGLNASVSLLDIAIMADDAEKTRAFAAILFEKHVIQKQPEDLLYGGEYLHLGAYFDSSNAVHELLLLGFDPNEVGQSGMTPLHSSSAVIESGLGVMSELVGYGGNLEIRADNGETPIAAAQREGNVRKMQCLYVLGAKVEAGNGSNRSHYTMEMKEALDRIDGLSSSDHSDVPSEIARWCRNSLQREPSLGLKD